MDSNPDSDHLSHVDCDPDSNPDSGPGARVNTASENLGPEGVQFLNNEHQNIKVFRLTRFHCMSLTDTTLHGHKNFC